MTRTARYLGMTRTRFRNASGLPNGRQVTTARDMATLGLRIQRDFPQYYHYFKTREIYLSRAEATATTTGCSAATKAPTASRPATRGRPASICVIGRAATDI